KIISPVGSQANESSGNVAAELVKPGCPNCSLVFGLWLLQAHDQRSTNFVDKFLDGLGHNLFSVGQFYDLDIEVAFRQHTCFIRNLEGVDLLSES
nr:integrase, catalytic region, zinc finger, CCHC-type, peptidase aspartic, catalytic [Tanacetum cinerariifolium]